MRYDERIMKYREDYIPVNISGVRSLLGSVAFDLSELTAEQIRAIERVMKE